MEKEYAKAAYIEEPAEVKNETKQVKTINRRGVGNARGTTRLKFSHELARPNGLFIGHLDSVAVSMITIGEDKAGMPSFNGLEIPKIVFTFASNEPEVNKRHYVSLQFTAVESNANTIPGGSEEWKVNSVFDWIKHVLDTYVFKGRDLTDEEANALSLPFEDFDENGEYVSVEPETIIAGWKTLFENVENILNRGRDEQSYYKTKDGKIVPIWMKLLRYVKNGKKGWTSINNGELAFPTFVGEGCVELYKTNSAPSLRINSIKESIIPMNIEKPKTPNFDYHRNSNMNAPAMGGVPVGDTMMGANAGFDVEPIGMEAAEDMPF